MFGGVLGLTTLSRDSKLVDGKGWPVAGDPHCIEHLNCHAQFLTSLPAQCREAKRIQGEGSNVGYAVSLLQDAQVYYEAAADLEPDSTSLQVCSVTMQHALSECVDSPPAYLSCCDIDGVPSAAGSCAPTSILTARLFSTFLTLQPL